MSQMHHDSHSPGVAPPVGKEALETAASLIERHPAGSLECERGLAMLEELATGPQFPAAAWLLGAYYLQATASRGAHARARAWLARAAQAGVPPAMDRLANLHLRGIDAERDPRAAVALLQRLAEAGYQRAAWEMAYLLAQQPDEATPGSALTAFARACALGYPPAYYSLGLRFAAPGSRRDPEFARALLRRADDVGYPDAGFAASELLQAGCDASRADAWYAALRNNLESARPLLGQLAHEGITIDPGRFAVVRKLEAHFAGIGHPALALDDDGRLRVTGAAAALPHAGPDAWHWPGQDPRVGICPQFATREECAHLRYISADELAVPSNYAGDTVNGAFETAHFKGRARLFGALFSDSVIRTLEQRIAQHTGWQVAAIEPCSTIAYLPGQAYEAHVDFFDHQQLADNQVRMNDPSGQRVATFLICLLAPEAGGGTFYPHSKLIVRYERGMAAMHFNVTPEGGPDTHSLHLGLPVERGEKWLLRTTLRERSRYL